MYVLWLPFATLPPMIHPVAFLLIISALAMHDQRDIDSTCSAKEYLPSEPLVLEVRDTTILRAEAILKQWPGDFHAVGTHRIAQLAFEQELADRLQRDLGSEVQDALLAIIARDMGDSARRIVSMQRAASYFYLKLELPKDFLSRILLSTGYSERTKLVVYDALRDLEERAGIVGPQRSLFVCSLANSVTSNGSASDARLLHRVISILKFEAKIGSRDASTLLNDPKVSAAASALEFRSIAPT